MPPPVRLLSIGEFSRLSSISVRMLRHYDENGVLAPTRVDPFSGYRSYAPDLLPVAAVIRRLRDLGLGVAELAACATDDASVLREVLTRHRARLLAEATTVADRLREVERFIERLEEPVMSTPITVRTDPAHTVAAVRDTIPTYAAEGLLWQRLMAGLGAAGVAPAPDARPVAVFVDDEYVEEHPTVEVRLTVSAPFADAGDVRCVEVPAQEVAVGTLRGSYEQMGAAIAELGGWTAEHGYRISGPMFNVYVTGPMEDPDPAAWVTEVCLPVTAG